MVDYIGRLELYALSVAVITSRLGLTTTDIPHANKGQRSTYLDYYDTESKEFVGAMYADDVIAFGYDYVQQCVAADTRLNVDVEGCLGAGYPTYTRHTVIDRFWPFSD